ncbi:MAG TPA: hypothetical protein VHO29_14575 [Marmoricola sp.]|nr:hypothetical protein [Marmoricola sp.]
MRAGIVGRYWGVLALAGAAALMRLAFLPAPEGGDEGGYLAVARQWHGAGPSLYGHYWVDRPPLLIGMFQVAAALGGLPALRVIGALAAAAAVLGVASACRQLAGRRAAVWSAAVAAALFVSPQLGTVQVNGELLAAPFVAWSIALSVHALRPTPVPRRWAAAFGAGLLAVAALLVKQNMAEPFVFAGVAMLVAWRTRAVERADVRRFGAGVAIGAATGAVLVGDWVMLRGARLWAVFNAMYPFRIKAARVLATVPDQGQTHRFDLFLVALLTSGVLLLVAAFAWALVRRQAGGPAGWALSATLAWSVTSMLLGGGFWDHYLVELIVPVGLAAGLALSPPSTVRTRSGHPLRDTGVLPALASVLVVVVALVHWGGGLRAKESNRGVSVGRAIKIVAVPGDTLVSVVGDAETVDTSGLPSPYPYLWTLPAQVDDPQLGRLTSLLAGPDAPTWLVAWDRPSFPTSVRARVQGVVARRYRAVGNVCGHQVMLRDDVKRATPPPQPCEASLSAAHRF